MKEIVIAIFASIGIATTVVLVLWASLWFIDLGNAFINKYKK